MKLKQGKYPLYLIRYKISKMIAKNVIYANKNKVIEVVI